MLILRILEIIFPIFAICAVGFWSGRRWAPDMNVANQLNIDIFVPALIFSALSQQSFDVQAYVNLSLASVTVILGSGLIVYPLVKLTRVDVKTFVPPIMFSNSGNMGLPLQLLAFGPVIMPIALVLFLMENLLHFTLGVYLLDHRAKWWTVFKQPMIVAAALALVVSFVSITIPKSVMLPIKMLGEIAVPLMLFGLGVRLASADFKEWRIGVSAGLAAPLSGIAIAFPCIYLLQLEGLQAGALILFAVLPPAVLNYMIAERYGQEPAKVAAIVIIGNLFALLSVPLALAYVLPIYG